MFDNIVGQLKVKQLLTAQYKAGGLLPHTLLVGQAGRGKSHIAKAMLELWNLQEILVLVNNQYTSEHLINLFMSLPTKGYDKQGHIIDESQVVRYGIFFDECHNFKQGTVETLYTALQDREVYHDNSVSWLPEFSAIFATNFQHKLPQALISRCQLLLHLEPYSIEELSELISRVNKLPKQDSIEVAKRARANPRIALQFARNYKVNKDYFNILNIDDMGLTELDRKYLEVLQEHGSMGLTGLASCLQESKEVITSQIEPELLRQGLINIKSNGRTLVQKTRGRLG